MATVVILPAVLLCVVSVGIVHTSPVRTYDQRQQGELNIHAQLDNIVIVLVPTSNFNLMGLMGKTKYTGEKPDKNDFLQIFQKPQKVDIDRYEIVKDEENSQNVIGDIIPVVTSQQVAINHGEKSEEKDEEVVATVEEMKPEPTEKATDTPKLEATEDSPVKEHSTISETVQESVLKVSIPEELKDKISSTEEEKESVVKDSDISQTEQASKEDFISTEHEATSPNVEKEYLPKQEFPFQKKIDEKLHIEKELSSIEPTDLKKQTIEDLIKPIAAKEEKPEETFPPKTISEEPGTAKRPPGLVEGVRREKVIRYKPENKWAPGLVDMLTAPRPKPRTREVEEKQRFSALCSPGTWDTELKTCIMPGETRSRNELARFLEAMRFGIAIPTPA